LEMLASCEARANPLPPTDKQLLHNGATHCVQSVLLWVRPKEYRGRHRHRVMLHLEACMQTHMQRDVH